MLSWYAGFILVMCSLESTHDSDPTPAIVSPIPTPDQNPNQ